MTLFELVIPLGQKTRADVVPVIIRYVEDSHAAMNNLTVGTLSEVRTRVYYGNDNKAHAEEVVVFEGRGPTGFETVLYKPHLRSLAALLARNGFQVNEESVWTESVPSDSDRSFRAHF
jgi:hypothetical protein